MTSKDTREPTVGQRNDRRMTLIATVTARRTVERTTMAEMIKARSNVMGAEKWVIRP
jgi:hypothetical protein